MYSVCSGTVRVDDPPFREHSKFDYLIIAPENPDILTEANRLAELKSERGLRSIVISVNTIVEQYSGIDTPEKIRSCIQNAYTQWGISWVLLFGDYALIPARKANVGNFMSYTSEFDTIRTDLYYACLGGSWDENNDGIFGNDTSSSEYRFTYKFDSTGTYVLDSVTDILIGTDFSQEVTIGRLPVSNQTEAKIVVDKIIAYSGLSSQTASAQNILLFGPQMFGFTDAHTQGMFSSDVGDYLHYQIRPELQKSGSPFCNASFNEIYEDSITADNNLCFFKKIITPEMLNAEFSLGPNIVIFTAHGCYEHILINAQKSLKYGIADALRIKSPTYSNIMALSCNTMEMPQDSMMCLAKSFLVNPNGGAISYVGSVVKAFGDELDSATAKITTLVSAKKTFRLARAYQNVVPSTNRYMLFYWQYWGDPELEFWTKKLTEQDSISITISNIGDHFRVSTTPPLDSILVCAYKPGALFARGYTKAGIVEFDTPSATLDSVKITATRHDLLPGHLFVNTDSLLLTGTKIQAKCFEKTSFSFFTNNKVIHVQNNSHQPVSVLLFDVAGRLKYTGSISGRGITLPDRLPTGLYVLRMQQGSTVIARSVLIGR